MAIAWGAIFQGAVVGGEGGGNCLEVFVHVEIVLETYMPRVLTIVKFWIWQGPQYENVTQRSEYARMYLERALNVP